MNTFEKIATILGTGVAVAAAMKCADATTVNDEIKKSEPENVCMYSDVLKAIYQTDMYSTTRDRLTRIIPVGAPSDYYAAIIQAIKNKRFDSNMLTDVRNITKAFGYRI